jgi:hypothetical protein
VAGRREVPKVEPRRGLVLAVGLGGAVLCALALPAAGGRLAELTARPGLERLAEGGRLTPEGYGRALGGAAAALDWLAEPRLQKDLAYVLQGLAAREAGPAATGLLSEARRRLEAALEEAPADPGAWLRLAQVDAALLDLAGAALALRASHAVGRVAPEVAVARSALALGLWEWLAEPVRERAGIELARTFPRDPAALVRVAAATGRLDELRALLEADPAALAALDSELAALRRTAAGGPGRAG